MKQFIKENPTLAFGLGLPILLVVIFLVAAGLPNLTAIPPKYDVVFTNNQYDSGEGFRVKVVGGKLNVTFVGECSYCNTLEIYRYNAAAGTVKRITVDAPPESRSPKETEYNQARHDALRGRVLPVEVPELKDVKLDDNNPAPDGYVFSQGEGYSSSGILPSLFFSRSSSNYEPVLRNGTYRMRLPIERGTYYYNARFIGWVKQ